MSLQNTIKSLNFFKSLNDEQVNKLCEISSLKKYEKDMILFYENDITNYLMFVITGLVKVYKLDKYDNEIFLYYISENSMISYFTSLEQKEILCFSNTEIVKDTIILSINFEKFNQLFLSQNVLTREFIEELLVKNKQLQFIINRELVFNSTAKVAYMLHSDLDMFNQHKRQEISFLLHIQPETLSRVLKKLSRDKIISIESGDITILDNSRLASIFSGVAV